MKVESIVYLPLIRTGHLLSVAFQSADTHLNRLERQAGKLVCMLLCCEEGFKMCVHCHAVLLNISLPLAMKLSVGLSFL